MGGSSRARARWRQPAGAHDEPPRRGPNVIERKTGRQRQRLATGRGEDRNVGGTDDGGSLDAITERRSGRLQGDDLALANVAQGTKKRVAVPGQKARPPRKVPSPPSARRSGVGRAFRRPDAPRMRGLGRRAGTVWTVCRTLDPKRRQDRTGPTCPRYPGCRLRRGSGIAQARRRPSVE